MRLPCGSPYQISQKNFHSLSWSLFFVCVLFGWFFLRNEHRLIISAALLHQPIHFTGVKALLCLWISLSCPLWAVPLLKHGQRLVLEEMHICTSLYIQGHICLPQFADTLHGHILISDFELYLMHLCKNEYLDHELSIIKVYVCRL